MKKKFAVLCIIILFITCLHPFFQIVQAQEAQINVEVNPNLELFSAIYILAFNGSDPFIIAPKDYIRDVLTYFAPYRGYEAVKYVRKILDKSHPYYYRDSVIIDLSTGLVELQYLGNITNESTLGADFRLFSEFAKESNFMEFYRAHEKEYAEYTSSIKPYLLGIQKLHREFFGYAAKEYRVEYSYSLRIHAHAEFQRGTAYCIDYIYPVKYEEEKMNDVIVIFHEFTHPFVDNFLAETYKLFENKSYYLDEIKNQLPMTTMYDPAHFGSFIRYLNEVLTESLAEYFALESGVPQESVKYRTLELSSGLYPIEDFLKEYNYFEKIRKDNETLLDYAPIMAEHMGEWATPENISRYFNKRAPVTGLPFINRGTYLGKVVIVYGTQNPDKSGVKYDKKTAEELREFLENSFIIGYGNTPKIIVKEDVNLTDEDLRGNLILIGGPVANEITRELNDQLPVTFVCDEDGWSLKRNSGVVKDFSAFLLTSDNLVELPLNSTVPHNKTVGVLETIRNPWNEKNFIMVLAGLTRYGTKNISKNLDFVVSYKIFGGNYTELGFYKQYKG